MSKEPAKITFHNSILCEVIRREDNGKLILLGVFGGDLLLPSYPSTLILSVHVEGTCLKAGLLNITFHFTDDSGNVLTVPVIVTNGDQDLVPGGFALRVYPVKMVIRKKCQLAVHAEIDGVRQLLLRKAVLLKADYDMIEREASHTPERR